MDRIEEAIEKEKMEFEHISVPDELEARLRQALNRKTRKKEKGLIAAALILLMVCFYSFDAIAYYGKKIIGYDNTMYGNIKELNEKGRGQEINKSYRFSDGTEIRLDGIMFDDNKLIAFVKESSSTGHDGKHISYAINGLRFMEYINESGAGNSNEARTEINWTLEFEPPAIYEKWLSLEITKIADGKAEEGEIKFTLDRNKAMEYSVKQDINKIVNINNMKIEFENISISPIAAVVEGEITGGENFDRDPSKGNFVEQPLIDFDLIVNGETYNCDSRSMSNKNNRIKFKNESITIPSEVTTLKIADIKFAIEKVVDKKVNIKVDTKDLTVDTEAGDIIIKNVRQDDKSTYITIKSDVEFDIHDNPVLALFVNGKDFISAEQVLDREYIENSREYRERTFRFEALGDEMELGIKVVYDIRKSSEVIEIPISQ